jgi:hypothetical protein
VYWEVNLQLLAWLVARCHCAVVLEAKAAAVETCWLVRRLVVPAAASLFALANPTAHPQETLLLKPAAHLVEELDASLSPLAVVTVAVVAVWCLLLGQVRNSEGLL